jgi:transcription termination factor Rho
MTELMAFMSQRKKELMDQLQPLADQRKSMLAQLDGITETLTRVIEEIEQIGRAEQAIAGVEPPTKTGLTIKQAVLKVLEEEKRALNAQQILALINERYFDGKVVRSSLSPQLSRLNHDDKKIKYDGTLWSLRSPNEEGPEKSEPSFLD